MKMFALAAALLVSTAAVAQMAPETPATPPADTMAPVQPAQPSDMTSPPAGDGMAPAPAPAPMAAPAPTAAPEPVAMASYPRCSAMVTDQCRQSSARESDYKGVPAKHRRKRG